MRKILLFCLLSIGALAQVSPMPNAKPQFFNNAGQICVGCRLFSYASGTSSLQATYADAAGTTPNPDPIILNSAGYANNGIFLGQLAYKFVLQDPFGNTLWSIDGVAPSSGSSLLAAQNNWTLRNNFANLESTLYADQQGVTDILAGVNAAGAKCSWSCVVVIPPGFWSSSTSVSIPLNNLGQFTLEIEGTVTYGGPGYAIDTKETGPAPSAANLNIVFLGGAIYGTSAGLGGIHLLPQNDIHVYTPLVSNFTTGDGIAIEGSIGVNIFGGHLIGNNNNLHLFPTKCLTAAPYTCSPTQAGTTTIYDPNRGNVVGTIVSNALNDGAFVDGSNGLGQVLGMHFSGVDFEGNATGLECNNAQNVGIDGGSHFEAQSAHHLIAENSCNNLDVSHNEFINSPATPFNIELVSASYAHVAFNAEAGASPSTCFVNTSVSSNPISFYPGQQFTSAPLCVGGVAATPTGLIGLDGASGYHASAYYINQGGEFGFDPGPSKPFLQGNANGGECIDNPVTQTLCTWDNSGNWTFRNSVSSGGQQPIYGTGNVFQGVGAFTTTAATSDTFAVNATFGLTSASYCAGVALNATAVTIAGSAITITPGTNQIVMTHTATAGGNFLFLCMANH